MDAEGETPPEELTSAFLVVQLPSSALRAYDSWVAAADGAEECARYLKSLRAALPRVAPETYRGFSREVLECYGDSEDLDPGVGADWEARVMIRERLGHDPSSECSHRNADLLPDLPFAREVLAATDHPSHWEVIRVARETRDVTPATLGFDVGWWAGDHFSLVADTMIVPRWHPAPPEDFEELRAQAERLNGDALFSTHEDASRFREWYRSKSWAEGEFEAGEGSAGRFHVIRVEEISE